MKTKKNEPLKEKVIVGDPHEGIKFKFEDVKSAVQGLLEEIDDLYHRFPKADVWDKSNDEVCGMCEKYFKKLIKKWFADVINEEDRE